MVVMLGLVLGACGVSGPDIRESEFDRSLRAHDAPVCSISFSSDGKFFATSAPDGWVKIWNAETFEMVSKLPGWKENPYPAIFQGQKLYVGGEKGRIYQVGTWKEESTLDGGHSWIYAIAFDPKGRFVATGGGVDALVNIWGAGGVERTFRTHTDRVFAAAVDPEGRTLATASWDRTIRAWTVEGWKEEKVMTRHTGAVRALAFSPQRKYLVSAGDDGMVKVWEAGLWEEIHSLRDHSGPVRALAFSPDGKYLATGGFDGIVRLRGNVIVDRNFTSIRIFPTRAGAVHALAIHPQNRYLVAGCEDGSLRIWMVKEN